MGLFHRALCVVSTRGQCGAIFILLLKRSELLRFELFADDTNITERHHYRNEPTKMMVRHRQLVITSDYLGIGHENHR